MHVNESSAVSNLLFSSEPSGGSVSSRPVMSNHARSPVAIETRSGGLTEFGLQRPSSVLSS